MKIKRSLFLSRKSIVPSLLFVSSFVVTLWFFISNNRMLIVVFEKPECDLGDIGANETLQHSFCFKNESTKDIVVANVKSSCGCIVDNTTQKDIAPGKFGDITVQLSTAGINPPMHLNKKVLVFFKDKKSLNFLETIPLEISGNVVSDIFTEPGQLKFVEKEDFTYDTLELRVRNRLLAPSSFTSLQIVALPPYYQLEELSRTNDEVRYSVSLIPKIAPRHLDSIQVIYKNKDLNRSLQVPVSLVPLEKIEIVPNSYVVALEEETKEEKLSKVTKQRFKLEAKDKAGLKIKNILSFSCQKSVFDWEPQQDSFDLWVKNMPKEKTNVYSEIIVIKVIDNKGSENNIRFLARILILTEPLIQSDSPYEKTVKVVYGRCD